MKSKKDFARGMVAGYWLSVDLLGFKFPKDFKMDEIWDEGGFQMKPALAIMLMGELGIDCLEMTEILNWIRSDKISELIKAYKDELHIYAILIEESNARTNRKIDNGELPF